MTDFEFEIAVVGGGPAGLAAACAAAGNGRRVGLVDETPWLGGQIWRGQQAKASILSAAKWFSRFHSSGALALDRTCVLGCPEPGLLLAERDHEPFRIHWKRLILATGARELFLPFPGWNLPGVMGPGGLLSLVKNGWPIEGKRVVVAGSGPLLLAAADGLVRHGARVVGLAEQTQWSKVASFALGLYRHPAKLWQGMGLKFKLRRVPCQFGAWPVRADGEDQVQSAILTDGRRSWTLDCDVLACGFGLVPNVEVALALGCALSDGFIRVDEWQATSVDNVFCAGEPTGIGGADCALIEGQIAGFAASDHHSQAKVLFSERAAWHRFRTSLAQAFALRPELKTLAGDETVVCRCEDVTMGRLRQFHSWREAKLHARCGMGPCQGRVCGPATKQLFGWGMESVRPPISPAQVGSLIANLSPVQRQGKETK